MPQLHRPYLGKSVAAGGASTEMYDDARTGNFQKVLEYLVEDMRSLFYDGITSRDGATYFFAVIHVMGDWPFLAKAF